MQATVCVVASVIDGSLLLCLSHICRNCLNVSSDKKKGIFIRRKMMMMDEGGRERKKTMKCATLPLSKS